MEDKGITPEELKAAMAGELDQLFDQIARAMNTAQDGRIIADSEEPVRDAHAEFRQRAYQKALELLQAKQEAFSPSADGTAEQGQAGHHAPDGQRANPRS
jgi:hypothetical protein